MNERIDETNSPDDMPLSLQDMPRRLDAQQNTKHEKGTENRDEQETGAEGTLNADAEDLNSQETSERDSENTGNIKPEADTPQNEKPAESETDKNPDNTSQSEGGTNRSESADTGETGDENSSKSEDIIECKKKGSKKESKATEAEQTKDPGETDSESSKKEEESLKEKEYETFNKTRKEARDKLAEAYKNCPPSLLKRVLGISHKNSTPDIENAYKGYLDMSKRRFERAEAYLIKRKEREQLLKDKLAFAERHGLRTSKNRQNIVARNNALNQLLEWYPDLKQDNSETPNTEVNFEELDNLYKKGITRLKNDIDKIHKRRNEGINKTQKDASKSASEKTVSFNTEAFLQNKDAMFMDQVVKINKERLEQQKIALGKKLRNLLSKMDDSLKKVDGYQKVKKEFGSFKQKLVEAGKDLKDSEKIKKITGNKKIMIPLGITAIAGVGYVAPAMIMAAAAGLTVRKLGADYIVAPRTEARLKYKKITIRSFSLDDLEKYARQDLSMAQKETSAKTWVNRGAVGSAIAVGMTNVAISTDGSALLNQDIHSDPTNTEMNTGNNNSGHSPDQQSSSEPEPPSELEPTENSRPLSTEDTPQHTAVTVEEDKNPDTPDTSDTTTPTSAPLAQEETITSEQLPEMSSYQHTFKRGDNLSTVLFESWKEGKFNDMGVPSPDDMSRREFLNRMYEVIHTVDADTLNRMGITSGNVDLIYVNQSIDLAPLLSEMYPPTEEMISPDTSSSVDEAGSVESTATEPSEPNSNSGETNANETSKEAEPTRENIHNDSNKNEDIVHPDTYDSATEQSREEVLSELVTDNAFPAQKEWLIENYAFLTETSREQVLNDARDEYIRLYEGSPLSDEGEMDKEAFAELVQSMAFQESVLETMNPNPTEKLDPNLRKWLTISSLQDVLDESGENLSDNFTKVLTFEGLTNEQIENITKLITTVASITNNTNQSFTEALDFLDYNKTATLSEGGKELLIGLDGSSQTKITLRP